MAIITVNNHKSSLNCRATELEQVRLKMAIKAKNYFWSPAYRNRQWDGFINYITPKTGVFDTGLLDQVCKHLRDLDIKIEIDDRREKFKDLHQIIDLGELTLRPDQLIALNTLLNNKLEGIKWVRGIMAEATNYGKSIISAGTFASFSQKRKGLLLVNSKTLFNQALPDLQKLIGKDQVGWVSAEKGVNWQRVNVCMVQTLGNRIKKDIKIRNELAKQDIIIIDEYDEVIGRKDCQAVLSASYNAFVRLGFTGTELISKDKNRNQLQLKFTGPVIHKTTNKELVDQGISTKPNIKFYLGNTKVSIKGDWKLEYLKGIVKNAKRNKKIWRLTTAAIEKGPVLILFKLHEHAKRLMRVCPIEFQDMFRIGIVHHKTDNKEFLLDKFKEGELDVLVASMIIRRGKNLPKIRTLINAAGGDSESNILQIFGRALRKDESKQEVDIIEFFDTGAYLQRHSKHRIKYYKQQQFDVKELYKQKLKK